VKRIVLIVSASVWIVPATLCAAQASLGWPEIIALLTKARTQATTCVQVLKSNGDKASLAEAQLTYGMAEGEMDGVIAGLTTALVEGGDPSSLPAAQASFETAGKGLKEICDAAVKSVIPQHERPVGRDCERSDRALDQGDFRRHRCVMDAPCRERQTRARNEEDPIGGREMAQVQRHRRAIAAGLLGLLALAVAPALAEDREPNAGTELYDRPVLAIDPGMHTAEIRAQAVDAAGQLTSSDDRTMRVWSIADVKVVRTIWIPIGPKPVGSINSVAISPDGSTIAAGGFTERLTGSGNPIYIFDRESGNLVRRIGRDLPNVTHFLTFSPDGRYLAATMGGGHGLRVFDRGKDWSETFREDHYGDDSYGAAFARDGRLATTAWDGMIRLYAYDPANVSPNFRRVRESVSPTWRRFQSGR
jgi:hypothetical protein